MDKLAYYFGRVATNSRNRSTKHLCINANFHNYTTTNIIALQKYPILATLRTFGEQAASRAAE